MRDAYRSNRIFWWLVAGLLVGCLMVGLDAIVHAQSSAAPQCSNGIDDDGDRRLDFPADPDCPNRDYTLEAGTTVRQCSNGVSDGNDLGDGDTLADYPDDPGCLSAADNSENNPQVMPACSDGKDVDGGGRNDGKPDYPVDPGCIAASDPFEADTACSDGVDNDGDRKVDFPEDRGCATPDVAPATPTTNAGPDQADDSEADPAVVPPPARADAGPPVNVGPGGIPFAPNPLAGQGHVHNGSGTADDGRIVGVRRTVRIRPGGRVKLRGRLVDLSGAPIVGAAVSVASSLPESYVAHTSRTGRFYKTIRWGPSRVVVVSWRPWGDSAGAVVARTRALGMARVTLRASVRSGGYRFVGSVLGAPRGSRVTVQVKQGRRWVPAADAGIDSRGHYRARRPVTVRGVRYCFRTRYPSQAGSAYSAGRSRVVCRRS